MIYFKLLQYMKFNHVAGPFGDCTSRYNVIDFPQTVREFVYEVLKDPKEWGYIGIRNSDLPFKVFGNPNIEYAYGKLKAENFSDEWLNRKIVSVRASGGWSRMDYLLDLAPEEKVDSFELF